MKIASCRPYHSRTVECRLCALPDGKSVFKLYFVSIVGRDEPARYEWGQNPLPPDELQRRVIAAGFEGIGFIIAFPHLMKLFRFAPSMETVLHVRAFRTQTLEPLDLSREDGAMEFACYAEAAIAADEYNAWARAASVEEYLRFTSGFADGPVADAGKLRRYWREG